ncbi:TPA: substrate-binding domain-containing protein [Escherichia coli]|nr:substrate-binding domain-containing protein [Escherichia coli]
MKKNVTLNDVARLANVSKQTVSRALNNPDIVSHRTKEKILKSIKTLHYVPSNPTQLLSENSLCTIGVITTSLSFQAPSAIIVSIQTHAINKGLQTFIIMLEKQDYCTLQIALNELQSRNIKGVIINLPLESAVAERLVNENPEISCVFLDVSPETDVSFVCFDFRKGCSECIQYLWHEGHRHFGLLAGPKHSISARLRLYSWRDTLHQLGCSNAVTVFGDWGVNSGYMRTFELLKLKPDISAIVVGNDQMALGVLSALKYLNRTGDKSISVTGYDNTEGSQYYCPSLTTVFHDFHLLGEKAISLLMKQMETPDKRYFELLPVKLIIRQSTRAINEDKTDLSIIKLRTLLQQALDVLDK